MKCPKCESDHYYRYQEPDGTMTWICDVCQHKEPCETVILQKLCPKCGSEFDEGIVENECFAYGPGEDCDVCPHYDCCDKAADEQDHSEKVKPDEK